VNVVTDLDKFVSEWKGRPEKMFVIGGGSLYAQMLPYVDEMYLTEIDATDTEADVFFPVFNAGEWTREVLSEGEGGGVNYSHALYRRKKPHWQSQNKRI
jgi:dihydrofolate reductase